MVRMEPPEDWERVLIGKTLVDTEEAAAQASTTEIFFIRDLPESTLIMKPGDLKMLLDYDPHRLNILVTKDMKVYYISFA